MFIFKNSTWLHLRIPFSYYLMPIFCFALATSDQRPIWQVSLAFIIIHLFLYPASNAYNSYYDKDEGSIGGIENPPPVDIELWYASLVFDGIALLLSLLISWEFCLAMLIYGLVSKAYSNDQIRLKKYPLWSWLVVGTFQGAFIYVVVQQAFNNYSFANLLESKILFGALLSTAFLMGSYPMTQVYQHEEDSKRGDKTLSLMLGIRGTFIFTMVVFGMVMLGFTLFFIHYYSNLHAICFHFCLFPVLIYFIFWFLKVLNDKKHANFRNTMRLNQISATCMNIYFLLIF